MPTHLRTHILLLLTLWVCGLKCAHAQSLDWCLPLLSDEKLQTTAVRTDQHGNVLALGSFKNRMTCGGLQLKSTGIRTLWLGKWDKSGKLLWMKTVGNTRADMQPQDLVADIHGNTWLLCRYMGKLLLNDKEYAAGKEGSWLLVKHDTKGVQTLARQLNNAGQHHTVAAMAQDATGHLHLVGKFAGKWIQDGAVLSSRAGTYDAYWLKLDPQGKGVLGKNFGGVSDMEEALAVAVHPPSGNIWLGGSLGAKIVNIGNFSLKTENYTTAFVAKLSPAGEVLMAKNFGGEGDSQLTDLAVDAEGHLAMGGWFMHSGTWGKTALQAPAWPSVWLASLDASGNERWAHTHLGAAPLSLGGLAIGYGGVVYACGRLEGAPSRWGQANFSQTGAWWLKFEHDGRQAWARPLGNAPNSRLNALAVDKQGHILLLGIYGADDNIDTELPAAPSWGNGILLRMEP